MVWGEERPVKSAFSVTEVLAGLGLILLAIYLVSDPIGRAAARSYESAAQTFIDNRDSGLSLVALDNVAVKDLALQSAFLSPDPTDTTKVDFTIYENEVLPAMDTQDLDVAVRIKLTDIQTDEPIQEEQKPEPLVVEAMDGTLKQLLDNEDDTLLNVPRECSRSDGLIGLCNGLTMGDLIEEDASSRENELGL